MQSHNVNRGEQAGLAKPFAAEDNARRPDGHNSSVAINGAPLNETPLNKTSRQWLQALAYLYIQQRQANNAIVLLEALLVLYPDDKQAQRILTLAYLRNYQYREALNGSDTLLCSGQFPANRHGKKQLALLHLMRAEALWGLDRRDAARQALGQYQHLNDIAADGALDTGTL